jgi:acetyl/propionyl-CoA carboxylase alpha subunit
LSQFPVLGLLTNIPFLRAVIRHPRFLEGDYDTGFLTGDSGVGQKELPQEALNLARSLAAWAAHTISGQRTKIQASTAEAQTNPWRTAGKLRLP